MRSLFRLSHLTSPDLAQKIYLFWTVLGLLALSFTAESILEIFILPANMLRWLLVIAVIDGAGLILFALTRAGHVRQAGLLLVGILWTLVTWLAYTENGVRSPTVDIAYLVIVLVAGLVIDEQAGIITGAICGLTLLGLSLAGVQGLLPEAQVRRSILATWEADIFYLIIVIGLQYLAIHSIRQALGRANQELLERRRVEASLQKASEERVQNQMHLELQRLLTDQLEKERLNIARDLHDGPVQELIGTTFSLQGLIQDTSDEKLRACLQDIRANLQGQVGSLRSFAGTLRSATLLKFGLERAIQEHLDHYAEVHPEITAALDASSCNMTLSEDTRLTLFRIYQEAMNNITRHAHATRVDVRLHAEEGHARLEIQDNGVGFTPPAEWLELARNGHLGLVGMRERVEAISGRFEMESREGAGTIVRVSVPVEEGE